MKIKEIKNEQLGEIYYDIDHPSGLKIIVMPKENYSGAYTIFSTKYGSVDTKIQQPDGTFSEIPEGTAHFLEHKLFESEDLDAFERFAKTGASANAYTSFDRTGYLFSCTGSFRQNLEILLDFVQHPYFTQATVEKEQGIIGQEIMMYKDVADWEVMFNLLRALYHEHPVKIDIAGTKESIAQITADCLYGCYKNFYNLKNMVLAVAGNVSVEEVIEVADRVLVPVTQGKAAQRDFIKEPETVVEEYIEEELSVSSPEFMFGYKETWDTPERTGKDEIIMEMLLDIIAGTSSELYNELFDTGLINSTFSYEYFTGFGYSAVMVGGESKDPKLVKEKFENEVEKIRKNGINQEAFARTKKKLFGRMIMSFNDVEDIANNIVTSYFSGEDIFEDFKSYNSIKIENLKNMLDKTLDKKFSALSVIKPVTEEKV